MNKLHSFRKKPVVIEAVQFVGHNSAAIAAFTDGAARYSSTRCGDVETNCCLIIPTLEGDHKANVGDWIIKGVNGEFYPCKPDIFAKTYDAAIEDTLQPHQQRVVDEKAELDERREKLGAFKNSVMFPSLPWQEQERLNTQAHLMTMLSGVLGERIANF